MSLPIAPEVLELAEQVGMQVRIRDDGSIVLYDMEIRYEIEQTADTYVVYYISRGYRAETPSIESAELAHIEMYLTRTLASDLRSQLGLPAINTLRGLPAGVTLTPGPSHLSVLRWPDDSGGEHRATFNTETAAMIFAEYAHYDRDQIHASMLAPDGRPVYILRSEQEQAERSAQHIPWYRRRRKN